LTVGWRKLKKGQSCRYCSWGGKTSNRASDVKREASGQQKKVEVVQEEIEEPIGKHKKLKCQSESESLGGEIMLTTTAPIEKKETGIFLLKRGFWKGLEGGKFLAG